MARPCDVRARDRLSEVDFELPLAGGDRPVGSEGAGPTLAQLTDLLTRHLPPGSPLGDYPDRLRSAGLTQQELRGYLTGSLDAVLRLRHANGPSYVVVDYKTNRLPMADPEGLTAYDYRPAALAEAMMASHYPLQALLYSVALHRFLRWRQPGYEPEAHLGGVAYLFLRGMCGPATPVIDGASCGVFSWQPGPELVTAVSDLLAGTAGLA